ncbi:hypothetical protein QE152_g8944 [Popillia japonica]|uniref:Uncharacterized protein n=1 Tax=Popillia japonica TaxID=7064 RepID=A0AAW1LW82_POPJA
MSRERERTDVSLTLPLRYLPGGLILIKEFTGIKLRTTETPTTLLATIPPCSMKQSRANVRVRREARRRCESETRLNGETLRNFLISQVEVVEMIRFLSNFGGQIVAVSCNPRLVFKVFL